jgi:ABC-2 type transport system permease protein
VKPVLYDFKRGVLRVSTILVLVLFTLAGVGLAYLLLAFMAMTPMVQSTVVYSYIDHGTGEFKLEMLLLNPDLKPVDGEVVYRLECYNSTRVKELYDLLYSGEITEEELQRELEKLRVVVSEERVRSSSGRVLVTRTLNIPADYACDLNLNGTTVFGSFTEKYSYTLYQFDGNVVQFLVQTPNGREDPVTRTENETLNLPRVDIIKELGYYGYSVIPRQLTPTEIAESLGRVSVAIHSFDTGRSIVLISLYCRVDVEYDVYIEKLNATSLPTTISIGDIAKYFDYVGKVRRGVNAIELNLNLLERGQTPLKPALRTLLITRSENQTLYSALAPYIISHQSGVVQRRIAQLIAGSAGAGLFYTFFPVVVLYLVYVYIAKPRAQGALEFVLARPITRREIYTTRYSAGVLVITVVTALFYTTLLLALYYFTGILLDLYPSLLLYAGLLLSSLAFYSLCYMLSTLTSGVRYIVVSIILYVLFAFLWQLVITLLVMSIQGFITGLEEYWRILYTSYYFNPLGVYQFAQYYYLQYYALQQVGTGFTPDVLGLVNPWLVGVSTVAWISVPVVLGWLRFRKISLIS